MTGPHHVRPRAPDSGPRGDGGGSGNGRARRLRLVLGWCLVAALAVLGALGVLRGLGVGGGGPAPMPKQDFSVAPSEVPDPAEPAPGVAPDHLVIPALQIDAELRPVGVSGGLLQLPEAAREVGRWTGGAGLGAGEGTVLLAGHVDTARREPGALFALHRIAPGDAIHVSDDRRTTHWKAVEVRTILRDRLPDDVWRGPAGERRLVIVTCGGEVIDGHYESNVVVTAVPVEDQ